MSTQGLPASPAQSDETDKAGADQEQGCRFWHGTRGDVIRIVSGRPDIILKK